MKNLINIIEFPQTIVRGNSAWEFQLPVQFKVLLSALYWELAYNLTAFLVVHRNAGEFRLIDEDFKCDIDIYVTLKSIHFSTYWSGYEYKVSPDAQGMAVLEFRGSRAAFGQQRMMPETIRKYCQWQYCSGMWDARDNYFTFAEVCEYYRKVDSRFFWEYEFPESKCGAGVTTSTTNKSARHSQEGTFNYKKWEYAKDKCSHYSKGKTLSSHRGRKTRVSGYLTKGAPKWWWECQGEWRKLRSPTLPLFMGV